MSTIFWNCRGAGNRRFRKSLSYMINRHKVDILVLMETKVSGNTADEVCKRIKFTDHYRVEAVGFEGGIWLFWNNLNHTVVIRQAEINFIHATIAFDGESVELFAVYNPPTPERRKEGWVRLLRAINCSTGHVVVGGDFNCVLNLDECGGNVRSVSPDSKLFQRWLDDSCLLDMGFSGPKFTWNRGRDVGTRISKRLDRVLFSVDARTRWPEACVRHLPALSSDHNPILLLLYPVRPINKRRRPFRFEAAWLSHSGFPDLVSDIWSTAAGWGLCNALLALKERLKRWNVEVFGHIGFKKKFILDRLLAIQEDLEKQLSQGLLKLQDELNTELELLLDQEEVLWAQKARSSWIREGDRNTRFFHVSTLVRRSFNRVDRIRTDEGVWISDHNALKSNALDYYKSLFSDEGNASISDMTLHGCFPLISPPDLAAIGVPFSDTEIKMTLMKMGALKAPGVDGFHAIFYQKNWDVVGSSVIQCVRDFFDSNILPPGLNETLISLIPKCQGPDHMSKFRPIGLCNVIYKLVTKLMVLRLKPIMEKVVSPFQSSFIPGRLIEDNVVLVQEMVHSFARKRGGRRWMAFKIDLEKAYDRLKWDFIDDSCSLLGLPSSWCSWIKNCIRSPTMRVVWDGEMSDSFVPSRGIRQGDPISPYLFVLCLERLGHSIQALVDNGEWKPIKVKRDCPGISHVFFADDIILFAEASVSQVKLINKCLREFCAVSGQRVSTSKSKLFVSPNVSGTFRHNLQVAAGLPISSDFGNYLGVPMIQSRLKSTDFNSILVKTKHRLATWKGKLLSFAGRLTLVKSVLMSIPAYVMRTCILPRATCTELDKLCRRFLWNDREDKNRIHLVAWDSICKPVEYGGLGLRKARDNNLVAMGKLAWRLIHEVGKPWVELVSRKYGITSGRELMDVSKYKQGSLVLRGIIWAREELFLKGAKWMVSNGERANFWTDVWCRDRPLLEEVVMVPGVHASGRVREFWIEGSGWDWGLLSTVLPMDVLTGIAGFALVSELDVSDGLAWKFESDGVYSTSSAFKLLFDGDQSPPRDVMLFKLIWKLHVPERMRTFLWLIIHGRILTNAERCRRHLSLSDLCPLCSLHSESLLHLFRDCPSISALWGGIVPLDIIGDFYTLEFKEWLLLNLSNSSYHADGLPWKDWFVVVLWWCWKWRNDWVFNNKCAPLRRIIFVAKQIRYLSSARVRESNLGKNSSTTPIMIAWLKPPIGWFKLNTDGAVDRVEGKAAAGGLIRDSSGRWLQGFGFHIGSCTVPAAELWGLCSGLYLCWNLGIRKVQVEIDSELVVKLVNRKIEITHPLFSLVTRCQGFLRRDWEIQFRHVFREANFSADYLASYAFKFPLGFYVLKVPPLDILQFLDKDCHGVATQRLITS